MKKFLLAIVLVFGLLWLIMVAGCSAKSFPRPRIWPPDVAPGAFTQCPNGYHLIRGTSRCPTTWACVSKRDFNIVRCIDEEGRLEPEKAGNDE